MEERMYPGEEFSELEALLRQHTSARVGIGRTGHSEKTPSILAFKMAHAEARDAVKSEWNTLSMADWLRGQHIDCEIVASLAVDKNTYLQRPDLGRKLTEDGAEKIKLLQLPAPDIALVVADGLSSRAVEEQIPSVLPELLVQLAQAGFSVSPVILVKYGRVAIADDIGTLMNARCSLILIGERPGLSSPDSLGAYITFQPQSGLTDASRNCISNIRPQGLYPGLAVAKMVYLIQEAFRLKVSGVQLKDNFDGNLLNV